MPVSDRAAQFIPFMALTGYEDAVEETARLTDRKIDLDETQKKDVYKRQALWTPSRCALPRAKARALR